MLPSLNTAGASARIASASVAMCGSTSYVTLISRSASSAWSSVAAASAATSSPWNITLAPGSSTASTALTPGAFSAALRSMATMRACGCGERRMRPCKPPGRLMSKEYFAWPVTLTGPSSRSMRLPINVGLGGPGGTSRAAAGRDGVLTSGTCGIFSHDAPPLVFSTASTTRGYVPHRQMLPSSAALAWAGVGDGFFSSSATAAITKPGVQNPHISPS
jgi:hypothetical protein